MIFVTVGSALPFDRLVRLVDNAVAARVITEPVLAQIGNGSYVPNNFEFVRILSRAKFDHSFESASAVISHAGIGTISAALRIQKPLLVLPRSRSFGELVDDHQLFTAKRFAELGHLLMFTDATELAGRLEELKGFRPVARNPNVEGIATVIEAFLAGLFPVDVRHRSSAGMS
jgi:beta-1,4-N-acetylglucosaminyltransferase